MASHDEDDDILDEENEEVEEQEDVEKDADEEQTEEETAPIAPPEPEEELPEEKPWNSEATKMYFGGDSVVTVNFTDANLPRWLPYIISDDAFWFNRTIAEALGGEEDGGEDAPPQTEAAPPKEDGEEDEEEAAQVHSDQGGDDAKSAPCPPFDPNMRLVLEVSNDEGTSYTARVYVPPVVQEEGAENDQGDAPPAESPKPDDEDEDEEGTAAKADTSQQDDAAGDALEEDEADDSAEVFIDILTLAAMYSPSTFKHCLQLKPKEEGQAAMSVAGLEDWCKHTIGAVESKKADTDSISDQVIGNMCSAMGAYQLELNAAHEKAFLARVAEEAAAAAAASGGGDDDEEPATEKAKDGELPPVPPCPQFRLPFDYSWIFEKLSLDAKRFWGKLGSVLRRLLAAGIVPSKPIGAELLRNSTAVQSYALLLVTMPRSLLTKWIAPAPVPGEDDPVPEEDGEGGAHPPLSWGVGQILLDIRTRNARAQAGKKDLRKSPSEVHKPFLPADFDAKTDFVIASPFAARPYAPHDLQVTVTDLLLLVLSLSQEDFGAATFDTLYKKRVSSTSASELASVSGTFELLFSSIHLMSSGKIAHSLISNTPPSVFTKIGLVNVKTWIAECSALINQSLYDAFSKQFWQVLCHQPEMLSELSAVAPDLRKSLEAREDDYNAYITSIKEGTATVESLDAVTERLGQSIVATPVAMAAAVESSNTIAAEWLFVGCKIHFVRSSETAANVPVLEYCLASRNVAITSLLVHHGADLRAPLTSGHGNGLSYIDDFWAVKEEELAASRAAAADALSSAELKQKEEQNALVKDLLTLWKAREHERATDPSKKYGLLLSAA